MQLQGMTPALLGFVEWGEVVPMRATPTGAIVLALTARRLFYWTVRFQHWDSCRYLAAYTAELQAVSGDPTLQTYVNWNNFDGRM